MSFARRIEEGRLALMMLTRLPVGRLVDPAPRLGQAAWAFPLVGLIVGGVGGALHWGALSASLPPLAAAFLALLAMTLMTGALHHDGLADFADGMGGGRDKAHRLEIMRDSRIGSYGVLALVFAVGLQASALSALPSGAGLTALVFMAVASRLAMVAALVWLKPARKAGLGRQVQQANPVVLAPGTALVTLLAFQASIQACGALLVTALAALSVSRLARRRIGGQTGDVLGAVQLVADVCGLIAWVAMMEVFRSAELMR